MQENLEKHTKEKRNHGKSGKICDECSLRGGFGLLGQTEREEKKNEKVFKLWKKPLRL